MTSEDGKPGALKKGSWPGYSDPEDSSRAGGDDGGDCGGAFGDKEGKVQVSPSQGLTRILTKYAEKCSLNAVPFIRQTKSTTVRAVWSCLLILALTLMSVHLHTLFSTYLAHKKQTQVQLSFSRLQFPAVTICNANPMRVSKRHLASQKLNDFMERINPVKIEDLLNQWEPEYDYEDLGDEDGDSVDVLGLLERKKRDTDRSVASKKQAAKFRSSNFFDAFDLGGDAGEALLDTIDSFYDKNEADTWEAESKPSAFYEIEETFKNYFDGEDLSSRVKMGHQLQDMLLQCSFGRGQCEARNFTRLQTTTYGNCYTLQYPKFVSRKSGPAHGLQLKLFLETDEYVPGIANSKGVQVVVHDQGTLPFPEEEGLAVMAGTETVIALKQVQITRLGKPHGRCSSVEEFKQKYGVKYTRTTCQKVCQQKKLRQRCGCYDAREKQINNIIKEPADIKPCRTADQITCSLNFASRFENSPARCQCYSPCQETAYEKTFSARDWPAKGFATLLKSAVCKRNSTLCDGLGLKDDHELRDEFLKLLIYYEDLNYEQLEESEDYQIDKFLSDIGGTIGLWIGLSVLSAFEIVHLLTDICLYVCCRSWRRKSS